MDCCQSGTGFKVKGSEFPLVDLSSIRYENEYLSDQYVTLINNIRVFEKVEVGFYFCFMLSLRTSVHQRP